MTLPNHPTMPLSTARASAPTAVVSLLTAIHLNPPLTFANYPHRIASSDLPTLSPASFTGPLNPTLPTNKSANRPCKTHSSPASAAPAASYKSPYRKCPGGKHLGSAPKLTAGALVDRELRFIAS